MPQRDSKLAGIPEALKDFQNGKFLIVVDDENRENECDLILAAEFATPAKVTFCVNHTTGILCAPMTASRASELQLAMMVHANEDPNRTAFTVTADSIDTSTGVSASDRSITFKQLADSTFKASQFRRPGHIFPLIARPGGVLERRGHTEAAIDLCKLAGLSPVGLIAELVNQDGSMKRLWNAVEFGQKHDIKIISIADLVSYRRQQNNVSENFDKVTFGVELVSQCKIPVSLRETDFGTWALKCFFSHHDGRYHVALQLGDASDEPILTRVHSECFTGDVIGSQRCDCGEQLYRSIQMIADEGRGVLLYNVGHEGRGIGLANKISAYHLQQTKNIDTYAANEALGFCDDSRNYDTAKSILEFGGIQKIKLITSNNDKVRSFQDLIAAVIPLVGTSNPHNHAYLEAKKNKYRNGAQHEKIPKYLNGTSGEPSAVVVPGHQESVAEEHLKSVPVLPEICDDKSRLKIGIIRASWNDSLIKPFTRALHETLTLNGIQKENITEVLVPGSFEIPLAAKLLSSTVDAIICVGILIKGETLHFEMISESVVHGLMKIQLETGVPITNAVFNCLTEEQAKVRCSPTGKLVGSLVATTIYMAELTKQNKL